MKDIEILITCEHASNEVPIEYSHLFLEAKDELESHRGYDLGVEPIAELFSNKLKAKYFFTRTTRLLVDCNRSIFREDLFSEFSLNASEEERTEILNKYYHPYRTKVEDYIQNSLNSKKILHLSMHSFTPEYQGKMRKTDVGLLLDESRSNEMNFCKRWLGDFNARMPHLHTALNDPYQGANDGFTTYFRNKYRDNEYLGIEVEINQKWTLSPEAFNIGEALVEYLKTNPVFK